MLVLCPDSLRLFFSHVWDPPEFTMFLLPTSAAEALFQRTSPALPEPAWLSGWGSWRCLGVCITPGVALTLKVKECVNPGLLPRIPITPEHNIHFRAPCGVSMKLRAGLKCFPSWLLPPPCPAPPLPLQVSPESTSFITPFYPKPHLGACF